MWYDTIVVMPLTHAKWASFTTKPLVDVNPPQDRGFMYSRSFEDVDGHVRDSMFVDLSRLPQG